jgi:hypothetical protein
MPLRQVVAANMNAPGDQPALAAYRQALARSDTAPPPPSAAAPAAPDGPAAGKAPAHAAPMEQVTGRQLAPAPAADTQPDTQPQSAPAAGNDAAPPAAGPSLLRSPATWVLAAIVAVVLLGAVLHRRRSVT